MKLLKRIFLPILIVMSLGAGCAVNETGLGGFNLISIQQEKELGDKLAQEVEKQHQVVSDPEVQAFVDGIGKRLLTGVRKADFSYSFKVVKDDNVNAFAIPGGHTYVNTGLIKAAQGESELAAVMAHEINHVVARHSTQQLTKQYGYQLLTTLLLGQNQSQVAQIAAELFGTAGTMYYSREMETQADYLGVETMYKAGYNPEGMATFFQKLEAIGQKNPSKIVQFFASHPQTAERINDVRAEIAKLPAKSWLPDSSPEFQRVKAKVSRL